jgi:type I restriction enzyme S subunit
MKKYDAYKDSGIEWIGEIPRHWEVKRFKHSFKFINEKCESELPKIGLEHVESWTGKRIENDTEFEGDGTCFQIDDILFGKLRPYLAKVFLSDFIGKAVGDFFVFRPEVNIYPKFGHKFLLSRNFIEITNSSTFGSKMPRVSPDFINELKTIVPPLKEQTAIANYLDRKTAEIDELIADKKRLLELYEEEKTAIINQAVTKGINPDVKMKDTGIEWLGEIPEHWEIPNIKYICQFILDGTHGSFSRVTSGYRLLSVRNIIDDQFVFRDDDSKVSEEDFIEISKRFLIQKNDIQLAIVGATLGKVAIVKELPEQFVTQRSVATLRVNEYSIPEYLFYFLKSSSFQSFLWLNAGFSAQPGIYLGTIQNSSISLPKIEEQKAIVHYIKTECSRIEVKKSRTEKLIELLTEYRTALISEVVTGKIKVVE